MSDRLLIYGAGGYIGRLAAKHAVGRGLAPILAGRRRESIASLADDLGTPVRVTRLDDPAGLATALNGVGCVLNCAGPFNSTAVPFASACIEKGIHYLDLAGEVPEFESLLLLDDDARAAGSMIMPGVGFGVVPTDCLAVRVQRRLPSATRLQIGFETVGGVSRGTASVVFGSLHTEGASTRAPADESLAPDRAALGLASVAERSEHADRPHARGSER